MISYPSVRINKKGKKDPDIFNFADVFFTQSLLNRCKKNPSYNSKKTEGISNEPDYYNYGYIKNYFQILNDRLNKKEMLNVRDGMVNKEKLNALKEQTLFVPDWILKTTNAITGGLGKIQESEDLFSKYGYLYKLISY